MTSARIRASALAAILLGWSVVAPRVPLRWHPLPHAVLGTAAAASTPVWGAAGAFTPTIVS